MLDTNTKLLLHCDYGVDGTTIIDSSSSGYNCTPEGSAHIVTSPDKFGAAPWYRGALSLDGDGDYVSIPDSDDWNFGTGDFTIDFWFNRGTVQKSYQTVIKNFYWQAEGPAGGGWMLGLHSQDAGQVYMYIGIYNSFGSSLGFVFQDNTWTHIACVKTANLLTWYQDGVSCGTSDITGFNTVNGYAQNLELGSIWRADVDSWLNGYLDEVRVSKGIARWTTNFVPYCGLEQGKAYGHSPTPCFRMLHLGAGFNPS